jgi:hypothetical protein
MPSPRGFDDPALASIPPAGNLYFAADVALAAPTQRLVSGPGHVQQTDLTPPALMFGGVNAQGEAVVHSADNATGRGHWSEIFNFSGSPAPWILIGVLLVAGLLHLSANARGKVEL